ncbi:MAG: T9SS type A sorting domain-containing protein [Bacteroidales bacterium]|nr:T9SS type A sorting domain-containing protein [Bacteroidales bacterium]
MKRINTQKTTARFVAAVGLFFAISVIPAHAQIYQTYFQGFEEAEEENYSFSSGAVHSLQTSLYSSGSQSLKITQTVGIDIVLTTDTIDFSQNTNLQYIALEFDHICDINPLTSTNPSNVANVYVKRIDESVWTKLSGQQYAVENGAKDFNITPTFSNESYATWRNTTMNNSLWRHERFNVNNVLNNATTQNRKIQFRFELKSRKNDPSTGPADGSGWYLDAITVRTSQDPMIDPTVTLRQFAEGLHANSRGADIVADIKTTVAAGINPDSVYITYSIGSNPTELRLQMEEDATVSGRFKAHIPFNGYDTLMRYHIVARDMTSNMNTGTYPVSEAARVEYRCVRGKERIITFDDIDTSGAVRTKNNKHPFPVAKKARTEYVIDQAQMRRMGYEPATISAMTYMFYNQYTGSLLRRRFQLALKNVPSTYAVTNEKLFSTNTVVVYEGDLTVSAERSTNTQTINFNIDSFYYAGQDIIVEMTYSDMDNGSEAPLLMQSLSGTEKQTLYQKSTNNTDDPYSYYKAGNTEKQRPFLAFNATKNLPLYYDAGIDSMAYPNFDTPTTTADNEEIIVRLRNFGVRPLTAVRIAYKVDDREVQYYDWTGNLGANETALVTICNTLQVDEGYHSLTSWVEDTVTSGTIVMRDHEPYNDTCKTDFISCAGPMHGVLTVGGENDDYVTLQQFLYAVERCGIDSTLNVLLAPGDYRVMVMPHVNGLSPTSYIKFQANNGRVRFIGDGSTPYMVDLTQAQHIRFEKIDFVRLPATASSVTDFVKLDYYSTDCHFDSCLFADSSRVADYLLMTALISSNGADSLTIRNCTFYNGQMGVNLAGDASDDRSIGNSVFGSTFINQRYSGVEALNQTNVTIDSNTFTGVRSNDRYVVRLQVCDGVSSATRNKIFVTKGAGGIGVTDIEGTASVPIVIANNMIEVIDDGSAISLMTPLNIITAAYADVVYNSVKLIATSRTNVPAAAFGMAGSLEYSRFMNNILAVFDETNYALSYYPGTSTTNTVRNNLYYTGGTILNRYNAIVACNNLEQWAAQVTADSNSISFKPDFLNATHADLRTYNRAIKGKGMPVSTATTDLLGNPRDTVAPCIGAFEFATLLYDFTVSSLSAPLLEYCSAPDRVEFVPMLRNIGVGTYDVDTSGGTLTLYCSLNEGPTHSFNVSTSVGAEDSIACATGILLNVLPAFQADSVHHLKVWLASTLDPNPTNDTNNFTIVSHYHATAPTGSNLTVEYGNTAQLTANRGILQWPRHVYNSGDKVNSEIYWYTTPDDEEPIYIGTTYTTPPLRDTVTYYAEQKRNIPLMRITQVQIRKSTSTDGAPLSLPSYFSSSTQTSVMMTNVGSAPASMRGDRMDVVSSNNDYNGKTYSFPDITVQPGQSIVVQWTRSSANDDPTALITGNNNEIPQMQIKTEIGFIYYHNGEVDDAVAMNGITSRSAWTSLQIPNYIWSGGGITMPTRAPAGIIRDSWPDPNSTPSNTASYWVMASNSRRLTPGVSDPNLFLYAENGCRGDLGRFHIDLINVPLSDIELYNLEVKEGCDLGNEPVSLMLSNFGIQKSDTVFINYSTGNETYQDTIAEGIEVREEYAHTFSHLLNMKRNDDTTFNIIVWVDSVNGDLVRKNDTVKASAISRFTLPAPEIEEYDTIDYATQLTMQLPNNPNAKPVWYDRSMTMVGVGPTYTSPYLYIDDTFYVSQQVLRLSHGLLGDTSTVSQSREPRYPNPWQTYNVQAREQYIITAQELYAMGLLPGDITAISYKLDEILYSKTNTYQNFAISIGSTTDSVFKNKSDWKPVSDVYVDSNMDMSTTTHQGWVRYEFSTPFEWDGLSNIVIQDWHINTRNTSGVSIYYNTSTQNRSLYATATRSTPSLYGSDAEGTALATSRPDIMFEMMAFSCESKTSPIYVTLTGIPDTDATVMWPTNERPIEMLSCSNSVVNVNVRNLGSKTLNDYTLRYSIDGEEWQTKQITDANLASAQIANVALTTTPLSPGRHHVKACIIVAGDTISANDTIEAVFKVKFCGGNYTIGTNQDFATFSQAIDTMNAVGIGGAVTFDVMPDIYREQVLINNIQGNDSINTITFRAAGDGVSIQHTPVADSNYVLRVSNSESIVFDGIGIKSIGANRTANADSYANAVVIDSSTNVSFTHCNIRVSKSDVTPSTDNVQRALASSVVIGNNVVGLNITHTVIDSGYCAIANVPGSAGIRGITVTNSKIIDFLRMGIRLEEVADVVIKYDTVRSSAKANRRPLNGIWLYSTAGKTELEANHVYVTDAWLTSKVGIRLSNIKGTQRQPVTIVNNMVGVVSQGGSRPSPTAMYIDSSANINIYYNSMSVDGMTRQIITSQALFVGKACSRMQVVNNIMSNTAEGYAYYVESDTSIITSNYNAYYSNADSANNKIIYFNKTAPTNGLLDTLQARYGTESQSVVERPYFAGEDDLHLVVGNMSEKALYNSDVTVDIDGNARPYMPKPSIGAFEMPKRTHDISIVEITNPVWPESISNPNDVEGDEITVNVTFYNNGNSTERNVTWYAEVVGTSIASTTQVINTFSPQTFIHGTVKLKCTIGVLDTQYVRVYINTSSDEAPENNERDSRFYLSPAYNLQAVSTVIHDIYRDCYRDQNPISIVVTNRGKRAIPSGAEVEFGFDTKMHTTGITVPTIPAVNSESYRFKKALSVGDTDTIMLATRANLYPTGLTGPNAPQAGIQVDIRTWVSYPPDLHPENDTTEYARCKADFTPTAPVGHDTNLAYGTWGAVTAEQAERNYVVRWYRAPDTSTAYFWPKTNNALLSFRWSNTPQYFHDSTYYLICRNTQTGCESPFSPVHVRVNPKVEKDVAIEAILSPEGGRVYMENDTVRVRIVNYGTQPQTSIPITYVLMNSKGTNRKNPYQLVTETYEGVLGPSDTLYYKFKTLANLKGAVATSPTKEQTFSITAYTSLPGDMTKRNDTMREDKQFKTLDNEVAYNDDRFKPVEPSELSITRVSFGTRDLELPPLQRTYFNRPVRYMADGRYDIPPLHVTRGMTDSLIIGVANNTTSSDNRKIGGLAVFIDWNRDGNFECDIDTANKYVLYGDNPPFADEVVAWGHATSNIGNFGTVITVPKAASLGMTRMRIVLLDDTTRTIRPNYLYHRIFNTTSGPEIRYTEFSEAHILDLLVFVDDPETLPDYDVALNRMVAPHHNIIKRDSVIAPKFAFSNKGKQTLSLVQFECNYVFEDTLRADTTFIYTWHGTLNSGQTALVTLPTDTMPEGITRLTIKAMLEDDADSSNNILWHEIFRPKVLVLAMEDNFDLENNWFAPKGHTRLDTNFWQRGYPTKQRISAPYSDSNAWVTHLSAPDIVTGYYGSKSVLYSPVFDISQVRPDTIFFWLRRNINEGSRMYMEYWNYDGFWSKVEHDSLQHWYNNTPEDDKKPVRFFDGTNTEYELVYFSLTSTKVGGNFPEMAQFRFVYETNPGNTLNEKFGEGAAIDEFSIGHARRAVDVGVVAITYPTEPKYGQTIRPEVIVHNFGNDTIRSFNLAYKPFGSNLSKIGTYNGLLPPDGEDLFKFDAPFIVTSNFPDTFSICAYTNVNTDIYWENDTVCSHFYLAPLEHDLEMIEFLLPESRVIAGDSLEIAVRFYNFGLDSIYLTDLVYEFNGEPPVRETVNIRSLLGRPLRYREYFNYTFKKKVRASLGQMSAIAYSSYSLDDYPYNDTINTILYGITTIVDLKANSIVIDTTSGSNYSVTLMIDNVGARGVNDFEVGMYFGSDTNNIIRETYHNNVPLAALSSGYWRFHHTFTDRSLLDSITAFVSIADDNNRKNDTTRMRTEQFVDIALEKVYVIENRNNDCVVKAQYVNRGSAAIHDKQITFSATINDQTITKTVTVENLIPNQVHLLDFDDRIPKNWDRIYEGSASVAMAGDVNEANNQTTLIEVANYIDDIPSTDEGEFVLEQNYPNPFHNETNIEFAIPNAGQVKFYIIDVMGHIVSHSSTFYAAGRHTIALSMDSYATGIYYYAVEFGGERLMRKMVIY